MTPHMIDCTTGWTTHGVQPPQSLTRPIHTPAKVGSQWKYPHRFSNKARPSAMTTFAVCAWSGSAIASSALAATSAVAWYVGHPLRLALSAGRMLPRHSRHFCKA
eukprot:GILK01019907.1.p2 GENE.GILK01019907.1~~GILK01019907.1.p2  ORF type:complete len:105 (+),score=0.45 GILK01019907.1:165-479(+)